MPPPPDAPLLNQPRDSWGLTLAYTAALAAVGLFAWLMQIEWQLIERYQCQQAFPAPLLLACLLPPPDLAGLQLLPPMGLLDLGERYLLADTLFIGAYLVTFVVMGRLIKRAMADGGWTTVRHLLRLGFAAAVLDVLENVILYAVVNAYLEPSSVASIMPILAALKVVVFTIPALVCLIVAIVWWRRYLGGWSQPDEPTALLSRPDDVLAKEAAYLNARRAQLGQPSVDPGDYVGVCLSGGGIRSATFNLGILQKLAEQNVLPKVDYLSTVSGGGYIGSSLSSLLSLRAQKAGDDGEGGVGSESCEYGADDRAHFAAAGKRSPFDARDDREDRLNGGDQLQHLRTHGDFLMQHRSIIHRDVIRTLGNLLSGWFYHLGIFLLGMAVLATIYLGVVTRFAGRDVFRPRSFDDFLQLIVNSHDFATRVSEALVAGAFWMLLLASLAPLIMNKLDDRWFERKSVARQEERDYQVLWCVMWLLLTGCLLFVLNAWRDSDSDALSLLLPVAFFLGAGMVAVVGYAVSIVTLAPLANWRSVNVRTHLNGYLGFTLYLTLLATAFGALPWLMGLMEGRVGSNLTLANIGVYVGSLFGAQWLSKPADDQSKNGTGVLAKLKALPAEFKKLVVSVLAAVLIVLTFVLLCVWLHQSAWDGMGTLFAAELFYLLAGAGATLGFVLLGYYLDYNKLSLHYFYRDRLSEAYLMTFRRRDPTKPADVLDLARDHSELRLSTLHGAAHDETERALDRISYAQRLRPLNDEEVAAAVAAATPTVQPTSGPYHLVVTALNLRASKDTRKRNRRSDHFIFSKLFCGSDTTGYVPTAHYRTNETKLSRAMAISGAAASSAMGVYGFFGQSFITTLFNVRLGQWMENPGFRGGRHAHRRENRIFWPRFLLREMMGNTHANDRLINLSDGGHTGDNMGLRPLLQRRCRLIFVGDGEADADLRYGSLAEALRQSAIDEGIEVDIDLAAAARRVDARRVAQPWVIGRIRYRDGSRGWLVVLKAGLSGGEPATVWNYAESQSTFPHQTTADQFFDDAQFEAYRGLGQWALGSFLTASTATSLNDELTGSRIDTQRMDVACAVMYALQQSRWKN